MKQTDDIMSLEVIWPFLVRGRVERGEELLIIFRNCFHAHDINHLLIVLNLSFDLSFGTFELPFDTYPLM